MHEEQVSRRVLSDQVADLIADSILKGGLKPGDTLPPARELGERYGVSRTVIREALRTLDARGLISISQGRLPVVSDPGSQVISDAFQLLFRSDGEEKVIHLLDIRQMIEPEVCARAALKATEKNKAKLKEALELHRSSQDNPMALLQHDLRFHLELACATQNPLVLVMLEPVMNLMKEYRLKVFRSEYLPEAIRHHTEIFDRICARDPEGARQAMKAHLAFVEKEVSQYLAEKEKAKDGSG